MYLPTDGDYKINSKNAGFAKLGQQRSLVPRLNGAFTCAKSHHRTCMGESVRVPALCSFFFFGLFEGTYRACRFEDLKSADASSRGRFSYSKIAIKQLQRSTEKYQRGHYIRSNEAINAQSNSAFDLCQCLRPTSTSFHIPFELR